MECASLLNDLDYLREFGLKIETLRVPFSGGLDLTNRCNLKCIHCYLGSARYVCDSQRGEMEKEKVLSLLDEIRDAGCLNLLITGGEPLVRADFGEVYEHAKRIGLVVTLFTNGTLITDEILELFTELPPCSVEISLYGATPETCERITGVPGSFASCLSGIERLLRIGTNLTLKTMLMSVNRDEIPDMEKMAKDYGIRFRVDAALFPRFDGDRSPLSLRVPFEDAVRRELSDEATLSRWNDFFARHGEARPTDKLYSCGAGATNFHIDAGGYLMPCIMARDVRYDLLAGSFLEGWNSEIPRFRERKAAHGNHCRDCSAVSLCGYCPAYFRLESGDENVPSPYLCDSGKARYSAITNGLEKA